MDNNETNFKYDMLKLYFGDDYEISDKITIHQPTIGEIIEYDEHEFWIMCYTITANPTSMKLTLWEKGIDWTKYDEFQLFIDLITQFPVEKTSILFNDLDFTKFKIINKDDLVMVYMNDPSIQIDRELYFKIIEYLRLMLNIHPKTIKAKNKITKELIIQEEEDKIELELKKKKNNNFTYKSVLFPLISSALNHPGFKYKKKELKEVGIVEFFDSIQRLNVYEETTSLMTGMYMGMLDLSKINLNKELNWVRDLYD